MPTHPRPIADSPAVWAVYLASSWTWCIGMFLPALLMRDFGPWAFAVFAIPNIVGAAAMGWVLRTPEDSARLTTSHHAMMRLFSLVTIAFHAVFIVEVIRGVASLGAPFTWVVALPVAAVVASIPAAARVERGLAAAAYAVSAAALVSWAITKPWLALPDVDMVAASISNTTLPLDHLAPLAMVCLLGFLLCPYLDLTFHRARRHLGGGPSGERAARSAFSLGFGVLFAANIIFTAVYAGLFYTRWLPTGPRPEKVAVMMLAAHLVIQTLATLVVHLRALCRPPWTINADQPGGDEPRPRFTAWWAAGMVVLVLACGWMVLPRVGFQGPPNLGPGGNERMAWYRLFMSFYGLVAPAYVWIVMIPSWRTSGVTRARVVLWLAACALACPAYYMGFIERQTWWLAAGVGVVAVAALLARGSRRAAAPVTASG